jgi:hypothetical protein
MYAKFVCRRRFFGRASAEVAGSSSWRETSAEAAQNVSSIKTKNDFKNYPHAK